MVVFQPVSAGGLPGASNESWGPWLFENCGPWLPHASPGGAVFHVVGTGPAVPQPAACGCPSSDEGAPQWGHGASFAGLADLQ